MDKILFLKEFFFNIALPGIGLGLAGLVVFYYVLPKIFRLKRKNEEGEGGENAPNYPGDGRKRKKSAGLSVD